MKALRWLAACAALVVALLSGAEAQTPVTITIRGDQQFQLIHGWEAVAQGALLELAPFANHQAVTDELLDKAVDLGLTRLRLGVSSSIENTRDFAAEYRAGLITRAEERCGRYSTVNDNADPNVLNPSGFIWTDFDREVTGTVLPLARRLEAKGERLWLNVQYTAFTSLICPGYQYHHDNPAEYAEFALAVYKRLRDVHGITPDTWELMLEPDNTSVWTGTRLADAAAATAARLQQAGFTPSFVGPATTNASSALPFFEPLWQRVGLRPFVREMSYHRYSGDTPATIRAIGDASRSRGHATSMLELIGANVNTLHEDLTLGNVSAWQQFALSFTGPEDGSKYFALDPSKPAGQRATLSATGMYLRQYFRALRPGARRIGASSSDSAFAAVAADNPGNRMGVVVKADRGGSLTFAGLTPGVYTTSCWGGAVSQQCVGSVTAGANGIAVANMPEAGVFSLIRAGGAPGPAGPSLSVQTNTTTLASGGTLSATLAMAPGTITTPVDAYVVLQVPTGDYYSLQLGGGFLPGIVPIARSFVPFSYAGPIFQYTFQSFDSPGRYTFLSVLTTAGTAQLMTPIATTTVMFNP